MWASPAIHMYVCTYRGPERPSVDRTSLSAGWLGGWLAGCLRPTESRRTIALQLSGIVCFCCLAILGLEEHWGSSCRVLSGFVVLQFRASKDTGARAVGFCVVFLSGNFGPRGKLGSSCRLLSCLFERGPERPREAQRGPERPGEAQRGPERPREAQRSPESLREAQRRTERPREAQRGPESPT